MVALCRTLHCMPQSVTTQPESSTASAENQCKMQTDYGLDAGATDKTARKPRTATRSLGARREEPRSILSKSQNWTSRRKRLRDASLKNYSLLLYSKFIANFSSSLISTLVNFKRQNHAHIIRQSIKILVHIKLIMKVAAISLLSLVGSVSGFVSNTVAPTRETRLFERKPFITGNWKLNPSTRDEAVALAKGIADSVTSDSPCDVALFVPFPFMEAAQEAVGDKLVIGAEVRKSFQKESVSI